MQVDAVVHQSGSNILCGNSYLLKKIGKRGLFILGLLYPLVGKRIRVREEVVFI